MLSTPISAPRWRGSAATSRERRRAHLKEPRVQPRAVPIGQRQERMREREDDVHIRHVEQVPLTRVEPALPRLRLALRAVPIAARVIGDGLMSAGATPIEMPAECGGATAHDRSQDGSLLHTQPRMLLDEGVTLRVEDIGHLHGRPAHAGLGFRFRRDRGRTTGAGPAAAPRGFGAACKWRRERWRYTVVCDEVGVARAGAGSCAGRRPLPAGASHTNGAGCAG